MPAYGFFIRHVNDLKMRDVNVSFMSPEHRPAFVLDDVNGGSLEHVHGQQPEGAEMMVRKDVKNVVIN
jgi:hypothetical protein